MESKAHGLGILSPHAYKDIQLQEQTEQGLLGSPTWTPRQNTRRAMPTKLASWMWPTTPLPVETPDRRRSSAWLDGLRGFAAFLVYIHHHQLWVHDMNGLDQNKIFENGFGYEGEYHFAAFPIVRNFFTGGHYAVSTFYVISGYVLSLKAWKLIHNGDFLALGDHLASALFRRWLRLFLPVTAFLVLFVSLWHVRPMWLSSLDPCRTWGEELWQLYVDLKSFSFVFRQGGEPWIPQHSHLWSIPVEFKGSMIVFTSLLAFSRGSRRAQLWCQATLMGYLMYVCDGALYAMFVAGMMLCQLDLLASTGDLPRFIRALAPYKDFIVYHALAISLYLGGIPSSNLEVEHLAKMRGWYYLSWLKPQAVFDYKWFYLFLAATLLVASIPRIPWLKRLFESSLCQYLGRVSFALYMVHGPVLWTLGDRIYMLVGWHTDRHLEHLAGWDNRIPIPRIGPMGLELNFLVPHLILLPLTLLLAEVITRTIDTPSVKLSSWLYGKVKGNQSGQSPKYAQA